MSGAGTTGLAPAADIERVDAPTRDEFETNYVRRGKPVVLTGIGDRWPALSKWSPDYLKAVAGDAVVAVPFHPEGDFHRWYVRGHERARHEMALRELIDKLTADPPDRRYYMPEYLLHNVSDTLLDDIDFGEHLLGHPSKKTPKPLLFLGRDSTTPMHYHGDVEALLCQVVGRKHILLASPGQLGRMYARPFFTFPGPYFSQVDFSDIDLERFPRARDAETFATVLEPGEILFIPVHWWHFTRVEELQISVSNFWCARLADYHYPFPALQVHGIRALTFLRKMKARLLGRPWGQQTGCDPQ